MSSNLPPCRHKRLLPSFKLPYLILEFCIFKLDLAGELVLWALVDLSVYSQEAGAGGGGEEGKLLFEAYGCLVDGREPGGVSFPVTSAASREGGGKLPLSRGEVERSETS